MEDTNPKRPVTIAIIGSGFSLASVVRELNTLYREQGDDTVIRGVVIVDDESTAGLPFIDMPVHVDQVELERFTELARAIEPVVISFQHMASTAEQISAALGGWCVDIADISRQLKTEKINIKQLRLAQLQEIAYNPKLPDVTLSTRKKKKRGHNSARDRIFSKPGYC